MRKYSLLALASLLSLCSNGQFATVVFDHEKGWFNESQPLPAETHWMLTGMVAEGAQQVEVRIYDTPDQEAEALYTTTWKQPGKVTEANFSVPVNFKLKGRSEYTVVIDQMRSTTPAERKELGNRLGKAIDAYVDQNMMADKNDIDLRKHPKIMIQDLDQLMNDGLSLYRARTERNFPGFSGLVRDKIDQIDELRVKSSRFNMLKKGDEEKSDVRVRFAHEQILGLKTLCRNELEQYLGNELVVLHNSRRITDYPTERTRNVLPINVGYGWVPVFYKDGSEYDGAPAVGVSFPFGNRAFKGAFWSNTSLSVGILTNKLKLDGFEVTGPLVDRPIYGALGYKMFRFVRVNVGGTLLQNSTDGSIEDVSVSKMYVRPYVGVSLEINLWLGIGQ